MVLVLSLFLVSILYTMCVMMFSDDRLGAPGAGKGTISAHLSHKYDMMHYSVGDSLRDWMRENRTTPLAARIKHRLDNQGFLPFEDLMPFLCQAITDAINHDTPRYSGIIIDGFPRCADQLRSFDAWLSQSDVPLATNNVSHMRMKAKPDVVLSLEVTKHNAKSRYLSRGRENNDSEEKFQNRFAEYERETVTVEEMYRKRGISITVSI
jgi:UMP-CMP kinase